MINKTYLLLLIPIFFITFVSAVNSPFCTPTRIFNDSFEGVAWAGGWTESGEGDWVVEAASTGITMVGAQVAHVDNCDTYCNLTSANFSCLGQDECFLTYNYGTTGLDNDEYMLIDVWNVTNKVWNINVVNYTDTVAGTEYINLSRFGLGQNNSIRISFRSIAGTNLNSEYAEIDVVNITGGSIRFAGGEGTLSKPFEISNWTHLNRTRQCLNANYSLIANLSSSTGDYNLLGSNWTYGGSTFEGNFVGNRNRIHDLIINASSTTNYVGLFGLFGTKANISDFSLVNFSIMGGQDYVGGLVGASSGNITNVLIFNSSIFGSGYVGGLVGSSNVGTVSFSNATNVTIKGLVIGGLMGLGTKVRYCVVDKSYINNTLIDSGGLIGAGGTGGVNITSCGVTNTIVEGTYNGGILSESLGTGGIYNSYVIGVTQKAGSYMGGIMGNFPTPGINFNITDSYAISNLSGFFYVGGILGQSEASYLKIHNCTFEGNITATQWYSGGLVGGMSGRNYTINNSKVIIDDYFIGGTNVGGLIGDINAGNVTLTNNVITLPSRTIFSSTDSFPGGLWGTNLTTIDSINNNYVIIVNNTYGNITFLSQRLQRSTLTNGNVLTNIIIGNNSATVSQNLEWWNISAANITFTFLSTTYTNPGIYLDETTLCNTTSTPACFNITSLNAGTVRFNVTDWSNYTIKEKPGAENTCTYGGAGNWLINCADQCVFSSVTTISEGNNVTTTGSGSITFNSGGRWTFMGLLQYIFLNSGCQLNINSGGGLW